MDVLRQLWVLCTSASHTKGQSGQQKEIPLVLVSATPRALVTTPMVEHNFLVSVERDMSFNDMNEPWFLVRVH